ncbi:MAG: hypothetical protein PHF60_01485 [Candidatus ainarchaeum sp.]|nr:hypothetical protein [Candidatus ainarchaeum sp.]
MREHPESVSVKGLVSSVSAPLTEGIAKTLKRFSTDEITRIVERRDELAAKGMQDTEIGAVLEKEFAGRTAGSIGFKIYQLVKAGTLTENKNKRGTKPASQTPAEHTGAAAPVSSVVSPKARQPELVPSAPRTEAVANTGGRFDADDIALIKARRAELIAEGEADRAISRVLASEMGRTDNAVHCKIRQLLKKKMLDDNPNRYVKKGPTLSPSTRANEPLPAPSAPAAPSSVDAATTGGSAFAADVITASRAAIARMSGRSRPAPRPHGTRPAPVPSPVPSQTRTASPAPAPRASDALTEGAARTRKNFTIDDIVRIRNRRTVLIAEGETDRAISRILAKEMGRSDSSINFKIRQLVNERRLGDNPNKYTNRVNPARSSRTRTTEVLPVPCASTTLGADVAAATVATATAAIARMTGGLRPASRPHGTRPASVPSSLRSQTRTALPAPGPHASDLLTEGILGKCVSPQSEVLSRDHVVLPTSMQQRLIEPIDQRFLLTDITAEAFNDILNDKTRKRKMTKVLEGLGYPSKEDEPNPLDTNKPLLLKALREYVILFGFVPHIRHLNTQGFPRLGVSVSNNGGTLTLARALGDIPSPRILRSPSHPPSMAPAPVQTKTVSPVTEARSPVSLVNSNGPFVRLDVYPQDSVDLVMKFIRSHLEERGSQQRIGDKIEKRFALARERLAIQLVANKTHMLFRETDMPALIFVATMEKGSDSQVDEAIRGFRNEVGWSVTLPPWLELKLAAATGFWVDYKGNPKKVGISPERAKLAERANLLQPILDRKEIRDYFAKNPSKWF